MILERYRDRVDQIDDVTAERAWRALGDEFRTALRYLSLFDALSSGDWSQADLVLSLLRLDGRAAYPVLGILLGHPIRVCPPALGRAPLKVTERPRERDDRRVTRILEFKSADKRRLTGAPLYGRLRVLRVGMSLTEFYARGGRRKDVRIALRRGWMRLEGRA